MKTCEKKGTSQKIEKHKNRLQNIRCHLEARTMPSSFTGKIKLYEVASANTKMLLFHLNAYKVTLKYT
jgi:hypothetical protein